jgi:cell division protein FtsA
MAKEYKDLVVGLDIGTSKIMVVVAEVLPGGLLKIAGFGVSPSNGLKRGVVVNIDATVQSIQQALREAELMADCKIGRVYTGITGSHIRGINSSGMVARLVAQMSSVYWIRPLQLIFLMISDCYWLNPKNL